MVAGVVIPLVRRVAIQPRQVYEDWLSVISLVCRLVQQVRWSAATTL